MISASNLTSSKSLEQSSTIMAIVYIEISTIMRLFWLKSPSSVKQSFDKLLVRYLSKSGQIVPPPLSIIYDITWPRVLAIFLSTVTKSSISCFFKNSNVCL